MSNFIEKLAQLGLHVFDFDKPLYKYVDIETAKIILTSASLKFSDVDSFNDPLELHPELLDIDVPKDLMKKRMKHSINNYSGLKTRKERRELINNTSHHDYRNALKVALPKRRASFGILCLSEICDSTLMWSHYGKNHTGVCLKFQFTNPVISHLDLLGMRIKYTETVTPFKLSTPDQIYSDVAFLNWIFTKSKVWEYEHEVRIVDINRPGIVNIDPSFFAGVIYGLKTSKEDIKEIEKIIKAKLYKMAPSQKMYRVKSTFNIETNKYII